MCCVLISPPSWAASQHPSIDAEPSLRAPSRIPGRSVSASQFPGNATIITADDIQRSGAATIQEVIASAEGVAVLDTGGHGLGSDSSLSLRGVANNSRTNALVLVDGVRQNRITGDEVHWQSLPVGQVERIEIIRGGGGTTYGEGALSGVINIFTKHDSAKPLDAEAGVEFGSFGWQKYSVAARGRSRRLTYGTSYTRNLLTGYREYSAARTTTVTSHGGIEVARGIRASVNVLHSENTNSSPGGLTPAQAEARRRQAVQSRVLIFEDEIDQVSADLVLGPWQGVTWLINGYWRQWTADSRRSGLFTLTPSRGLNLRSMSESRGPHLANALISGIELSDDKASTGVRGGTRVDESNRFGYGLYLEDTLTLWDRLSLVGGFRYDRFRFEEDIVAFDALFNEVNYVGTLTFEGKSPKIGLTYAALPEALWVYGSFSRPFKAPNIDDFASRSSEFRGNVALRPQQANTYEIGARGAAGPWRANAAWFVMTTKDEILFVQGIPSNPFIFQNQNFDTQRFGIELAAGIEEARWHTHLTYTYADAEFRKGQFAGNTFPGTPAHLGNINVGISPVAGLWVDLDWQIAEHFFRINDVANLFPADGFNVLNLTLAYNLPEAFGRRFGGAKGRAYLKFQNLANNEYSAFQASNGSNFSTGAGENPMPPFSVRWGLHVDY